MKDATKPCLINTNHGKEWHEFISCDALEAVGVASCFCHEVFAGGSLFECHELVDIVEPIFRLRRVEILEDCGEHLKTFLNEVGLVEKLRQGGLREFSGKYVGIHPDTLCE